MEKKEKNRIIGVFVFLCFLYLTVLVKAFYVQVISREKLLEYSQDQIFRESKVYPNRGNIYDRNNSPLAINIQTYSIFTIPRNVKDGLTSYYKLAQIVPKLNIDQIKKKIENRTRYTWLTRKIPLTEDQVVKIKKLGKESGGIYIESVPKRMYPNNELLSQTLGFVGVDNVGLSGIEYLYDKQLRGEAKVTRYLRDAKGRPVKFEGKHIEGETIDIHLTVDKELQAMAEKALKEAVMENKALSGGIGVMDAETGEILAMANYPTFDPNNLHVFSLGNRKLSFISDPFEPGSIFKALTIISALEHRIIRPDTNYYCEKGEFLVENHVISEAGGKKKFEWLSVREILKYSSNIGTTKIAFDLTFPKLKKTLKDFKIGEKTGVEVPAESRGIFTAKNNITPLSLSNISFGQGIATTGIQILAAYAVIANGGIYNDPTIIKSIGTEQESQKRKKGKRIISEQTAKEVTRMLELVVEEGTGTNAQIPYFRIAGKTSTAQRPGKNGGYEGYIPGFVGFPVNVDNKFVIYVYIEHPNGKEYYGSTVAIPAFNKVAQYILYKNRDVGHVLSIKNDQKKTTTSVDHVKVRSSASRITGKGHVPNFLGLDKISSVKLGKKLDLNLQHRGIGVVSAQEPIPGSSFKDGTVIKLIYSPPQYD